MEEKPKDSEIEKIIEKFKKVPDWDRFPVPDVLIEKYGLPKARPSDDLMAALSTAEQPQKCIYLPSETRPPAEGGVREVKPLEDVPIEVKPLEETPILSN